jgi:prolyl oligopeptidase
MEYPVARRSDTVQHFPSLKHGLVQVPDPYDWMDDLTSQETEVFLEAQNALLSQYLTDPVLEEPRTKLVKLLQSIQTNTFINDIPLSAGRFYILRVGGRGHSHCMTFKIPKARIREFLEAPANVDGDSLLEILHDEAVENQVVIATGVSRSGKYWAYNASVAGSDWGVIRVKDIETGQMLPDEIHDNKFNTKPARISWLDDRGFFYQYWKPDGEGRSPPQLRFHVLGEAQAKDEVVYEDPSCPGRCFWATVSHDGALVFLHVYAAGWASQVYAARISRADVVTSKLNLEFKSTISNDFSSQWE